MEKFIRYIWNGAGVGKYRNILENIEISDIFATVDMFDIYPIFSIHIRHPLKYDVIVMLLWSPYVIGQTIIFLCCGLFFFPSLFFFSSPNLSGRKLDVYHTLAHGVALVRI